MTDSLVLLHIAQTAVRVTTVDPTVAAAACMAFLLAAVAIWLPRSALSLLMLRHRHYRRRAASFGIAIVVFLALLPSVLPYDHLFAQDDHAEAGAAEAVHASHCHASPATCSDAPITAGLGQLLMSEPLTPTPAMLALLMLITTTVLVGISYRPETRPPLSFA